uniref:Uncharacterized protein n=1 Tax=Glossina austeni TaxID=7395 RepID=A0A1A9VJ34_GLOAU
MQIVEMRRERIFNSREKVSYFEAFMPLVLIYLSHLQPHMANMERDGILTYALIDIFQLSITPRMENQAYRGVSANCVSFHSFDGQTIFANIFEVTMPYIEDLMAMETRALELIIFYVDILVPKNSYGLRLVLISQKHFGFFLWEKMTLFIVTTLTSTPLQFFIKLTMMIPLLMSIKMSFQAHSNY